MSRIELAATTRTVLGKKVRHLRREGLIPANLYGHKVKSHALQIDTDLLKQTLSKAGKSSLVALKIDGKRAKMVVFKDVQRDPLNGAILHADMLQVKMEEKIKLEVPLVFINEAPAVKDQGGILLQNLNAIEVECLPANMPHQIEIDLTALKRIDDAIYVKDVQLENGVAAITDPETSIVQITRSRVEAVEVTEEAPAEVEVTSAKAAEEAEED